MAACGVTAAGARERAHIGGCGGTPLYTGSLPSWTASAQGDSSGGLTPWVHALSHGHNVAAVVFGYPLRAGTPGPGRQNKVLWITRLPRQGLPLRIEARPLHASRPVVTVTEPADSEPGQIYPSYVNVPTAGCWRMTLRWAGHTDTIALRYVSR
jgi:hypothetical protein